MKLKPVLTAGLLVFAAVSLAVAVADVTGLSSTPPADRPRPAEPAGGRITAYYFHTNTRCPTCRAIADNARDAVAPDAESGAVEWRVVNYEEPAHRHFADTFRLEFPMVVLAHTRDGAVVRWKHLERVWELSQERTDFVAYVRSELAAFAEGQP